MSKKASPLSVSIKIKAKTATLETANHIRTTTGTVEISPSASSNTVSGDICTTAAMQAVKIKKELPSDEIKVSENVVHFCSCVKRATVLLNNVIVLLRICSLCANA